MAMANDPAAQAAPPAGADKLTNVEPRTLVTLEQKSRAYPPPRTLARWLLVAFAVSAVGWLLWNSRSALLPFILGLVLAYLLLPIVNALARRVPRPLAILIVYISSIALIVGVIAIVVPLVAAQVQQLVASLPSLGQMQEMVSDLLQQYQSRVPPIVRQPIDDGLANALHTIQANVATYAQEAGKFVWNQVLQVLNTVSFLVGFFIVPIWLFYVLNDQAKARALADGLLHPRFRPDFWNIASIANHALGDYVRGQLTLSLIIGIMIGVGMLILKLVGFQMNYALLLGVISATTELIPVIGPTLGMIPGILIGLFISPMTALFVALVYLVVQQIENSFLVPRIIGGSIGIHPAILTVIVIAMGYTFGLLGIVLAAPAAAIARDLFIYAHRRLDGKSAAEAMLGLVTMPAGARRKA
jgi:predicted PurR-regulated permease PerM